MDSPLTAYIAITCVSGVLNLLLGFYVIMKRELDRRIVSIFAWGTAAKAIYCFSYAFSLTSSTLEQLRFWSVMQYIGMPFAPPLGLLFVLTYLGIKVRKGAILALLTMPVISLISNATNDWHHLRPPQGWGSVVDSCRSGLPLLHEGEHPVRAIWRRRIRHRLTRPIEPGWTSLR